MSATAPATPVKIKREKDWDEKVGGVRRQLRGLERAATDEDPFTVADMLNIAAEAEAAAVRMVADLRYRGYRWEDIAFSLNVTALTAIKRYSAQSKIINAARAAAEESE
jgi:hypothetical protein